ncbi:MAG: peptidylprolyl isomerase [Ilumatobacteraceae bacterium]
MTVLRHLPLRTVRRAPAFALVAALVATGCGAGDAGGTPVVDPNYDGSTETLPSATTAAPDGTAATSIPTSADSIAPSADKPEVNIPDELPTELVVTELVAGDGPSAEAGDTVVVNYVGVRSEDGTEFDNSYDRGQPFPVTLGANSVIQGWEDGLVGAQAGARLQLDIPATLAYGDSAAGDVIKAGDALTFVIDVVEVQKRPVITAPPQVDAADCPAADGSQAPQQSFTEMQPFCIDADATYTAQIVTNIGELTVALEPQRAPQTVNNFVGLARYHYYDDTVCHRAIPGFVVQCGDPQGDGFGGPGYTIPDELPLPGEYVVGSVVMANTGQPDSGGSQFFIVTGASGASLPPQYTLFGMVTDGLDTTVPALDELGNPSNNGVPPLAEIRIESVTVSEG